MLRLACLQTEFHRFACFTSIVSRARSQAFGEGRDSPAKLGRLFDVPWFCRKCLLIRLIEAPEVAKGELTLRGRRV